MWNGPVYRSIVLRLCAVCVLVVLPSALRPAPSALSASVPLSPIENKIVVIDPGHGGLAGGVEPAAGWSKKRWPWI